jgi:hypothetical protein
VITSVQFSHTLMETFILGRLHNMEYSLIYVYNNLDRYLVFFLSSLKRKCMLVSYITGKEKERVDMNLLIKNLGITKEISRII